MVAEPAAPHGSAAPTHAVLVGQNAALEDVQWLNLVEGTDFAGMLDLARVVAAWNAQYNSWSVFAGRPPPAVKTLLGARRRSTTPRAPR